MRPVPQDRSESLPSPRSGPARTHSVGWNSRWARYSAAVSIVHGRRTPISLHEVRPRARQVAEEAQHVGVVRERAQALLSKKFRFLEGVGHEVDSVVSDLWIKLKRHFQQKLPNSLEHLLALLALSVHHLLLDKASILRRREQRHEPIGTDSSPGQPAGSAENDPQALAEFTEFQEQLWKKLQTLPEDQRRVFEMHYFLGISQARIAEDLTLHPRQVSRLWVKASNAVVLGWKNA